MNVSTVSITFIVISLVICNILPLAVYAYFKRKESISWRPVVVGIAFFFIFTQIFEKGLHYAVFSYTSIMQNPALFALYGALAAGLFEETARLIAFRYFLPTYRRWKDGMAYGIGHGGIEAFLIGAVAAVQMLVFATMLNNGSFEAFKTQMPPELYSDLISVLTGPSWFFLLIGVERVFAFIVQIMLSLLVLYGVYKNKIQFYIIAVLLHAMFDIPAVLYQLDMAHILVVEGIYLLISIAALWFIAHSRSWFSNKQPEEVKS